MSRTTKKPYSGTKAFDATCRNHGSCPHCKNNRSHNITKREEAAEEELKQK